MLDAVGTISGQQGFRVWKTKLRNAVKLFAPDLKPILHGADSPAEPEPDEGDRAKWDQANSRLFSLLFFVTSGSTHATVLTHEEAADATAAWNALNERFNAHTQEARRACHRERFDLRHLAGGDLIDLFTNGMDLNVHLQGLGEEVFKEGYLDITLSGLTKAPDFKFIREIHYREEFTSVDRLLKKANRFYVDQQSRNASGSVVSGRGSAMAASSSDQCHQCKAYGHFQRDCPQQVRKNRPKLGKKKWKNKLGGGGGGAQPKWCSCHNTTTDSDAECQKQQELRVNKQKKLQGLVVNLALLRSAGQVNLPNIGSAHVAQSTPATAPQAPAKPISFGFSFSAQRDQPAVANSSSALPRRLRRRLPPLRRHLHLSPESHLHRITACLQVFSVRSLATPFPTRLP